MKLLPDPLPDAPPAQPGADWLYSRGSSEWPVHENGLRHLNPLLAHVGEHGAEDQSGIAPACHPFSY